MAGHSTRKKAPQDTCSVVVTTKITPMDASRMEPHLADCTRSRFAKEAIREKLDRLDADTVISE